jgi:hypothetical protein
MILRDPTDPSDNNQERFVTYEQARRALGSRAADALFQLYGRYASEGRDELSVEKVCQAIELGDCQECDEEGDPS